MSRGVAFVCTLAVGLLVGLQPVANARMGQHVGDLGAAFVSIVISLVVIAVVLLVAGHPSRLSGLSGFRPEWVIGGVGGAAVVTIGLIAVRPLGAGGVIALLVAGQLLIAVLADRFGWFGLHVVGLGAGRIAGLVLVIAGTLLITRV
ncbi:MAG TPA: DMT family transporter [Solirubrobacteraceae bacterium]|jgi:transporter family-2 protein|nr:DMT family transporter [Solirubrobacteraceae bacterium]